MHFSYDNMNNNDDFQGSPAVSPLVRGTSNNNPMVNNPMKRASVIDRITQKRASMTSASPNALDPTTAVGTHQTAIPALVALVPPKIPTTAAVLPIKDTLTPFRVTTKSDSNAESEASVVVCTTTLQLTLLKDNGVCRTYLAVGYDTGEIYLKEIVDGARLTSGKRAIRLVGKQVDNLRSPSPSSSSPSSSPQMGASSEVDDAAEEGNGDINGDGDDDDDEEGDFYLNTHMHVKSKSGAVHSTTSFTPSPKFFLNKHSNKVMSLVSFQHLGQTVLVSASLDGTIRAWTLNTAYRPKEHSKQQSPMECSISIIGGEYFEDGFSCLSVHIMGGGSCSSSSRPIIASAGRDNCIRLWDYTNKEHNHYCQFYDYHSGNSLSPSDLLHDDWVTNLVLHRPARFRLSRNKRIRKARESIHPLYLISGCYDKQVRVFILGVGDGKLPSDVNPFQKMSSAIDSAAHVVSHNQVYGQLSSLGQGIIGQGDDEGDAQSDDEDPTAAAKLSLMTALDHAEQVKAITVWDQDEDTLIFSGDNVGVLIYWSVSASYDSTAASTAKASSSSSSPDDKSREGKGKGKGEKTKVRTAVLIPLRKIPDPNKKGFTALKVFDPKEGMAAVLISSSVDNKIRLWNIDSGEVLRCMSGHEDNPVSIEVFLFNNTHESSCFFEPLIITADQKKFIAWNFQSKEELRSKSFKSQMEGHEETINAVVLFYHVKDKAKACPLIATASADKTCRIFNYSNKALVARLVDKTGSSSSAGHGNTSHSFAVTCIASHVDELNEVNYIITGGEDNVVKVWRLLNIEFDEDHSKDIKFAKSCEVADPYVVRLHKNHVVRVGVICPVRKDDCNSKNYDPSRRNRPKVVSASSDRTIKSFDLQPLTNERHPKHRTYKGHTDMIDNMVLFDGYIPSSSSTSRPKIVSSAYWDVFIWDFYDSTFLQYYQYCGLLTAVVPPFEDPYVVGVNDKDRIITFNPFATNASKSAFLVKGHEPKNKVKYDSIVISIDHYVREDKVVVVTGHDDGSIRKVDPARKKLLTAEDDPSTVDGGDEDESNDSWGEDDGNDLNDVITLATLPVGTSNSDFLIASGYRTAAARVHKHNKLKEDPILIQGRDAYVVAFIPFDSKDLKKGSDSEANLVLAGCYDKVVRLVDVMTGTDRPIEGTSNRFANYVDMHFLKKGDKAGSFHFLLVAGGERRPFHIYHVEGYTQLKEKLSVAKSLYREELPGESSSNNSNSMHDFDCSGLRFLHPRKGPSSSSSSSSDGTDYPLVVSANKSGELAIFQSVASGGGGAAGGYKEHFRLYKDQIARIHNVSTTADTTESSAPVAGKASSSSSQAVINTRSSVVEETKSDKRANFPINCFEIIEGRNLLVLGTKAPVPILVKIVESSDGKYSLDPCDGVKGFQFKYDATAGSAAAAVTDLVRKYHRDEITTIAVHVRKEKSREGKDERRVEVLTGSKDRSVIVWDLGRRKKRVVLEGFGGAVTSVKVFTYQSLADSLQESLVVTGCVDKIVRLFNLKTGLLVRQFDNHTEPITQAMITCCSSKYDPVLLSASKDKQFKFIDSYFILNKAVPTHPSIVLEYYEDREEMVASGTKTLSKDKLWPRINQFAKMTTMSAFFSENADLFSRSLSDAENLKTFTASFLSLAPEAMFIPQKLKAISTAPREAATAATVAADVSTNAAMVQAKKQQLEEELEEKLEAAAKELQDKEKHHCCYTLGLSQTEAIKEVTEEEGEGEDHPAVSPLEIAMEFEEKMDVQVVLEAMSTILNTPLNSVKHDYYSQFFPFAKRIDKKDFMKIAAKYPVEYISFLKSIKLQKVYPIALSDEPLSRPFERDEYKFKGISSNTELVNLWSRPRKHQQKEKREEREGKKELSLMVPLYIPIPFAADFDVLGSYLTACRAMDDVTVFDGDVANYALKFAWHKFGLRVHMQAFFKHVLFCALFTTSLLSFANWTVGPTSSDYRYYCAAWVLQGCMLFCIGTNYVEDIGQLYTSSQMNLIAHYSDMWNMNDLAINTTLLVATILRIAHGRETDQSRNVLAISAIFVYFKLLYYLRAFELTGPLISMIFLIAQSIVPFCGVLFVVLFGYSQSFWIISKELRDMPYGLFYQSLYQVYRMMLGDTVTDYHGTSSNKLGIILFVSFTVIVSLLLLNMLIALMGDTFGTVRAKGIAQFRLEQASIIYEQQSLTPDSPKDDFGYEVFYPSLIHVLVRSSDMDFKDSSSSGDQIVELQNKVNTLESKLDRIFKLLLTSDQFKPDRDDLDGDDADDENEGDDAVAAAVEDDDEEEEEEYEDDMFDDLGYDDEGNDDDEEEEYDDDDDYDDGEDYEIKVLSVDIDGQDYELFLVDMDDGWVCSGSTLLSSGCMQGCTGPNQSYGWKRFYFDPLHSFCEGCAYSNLQVKYVRKHIHKHRLVYKVRNNYICDMGDECIRVVQGKGDEDRLVGFGCEECDYDLCGECCEKFERAPTQEELMGEVDDEADDVGFGLLGTLVSRRNIK